MSDVPVALYMSAWIEIRGGTNTPYPTEVALYMSAWIEIDHIKPANDDECVALYMSAWIEMVSRLTTRKRASCRTLYECVD